MTRIKLNTIEIDKPPLGFYIGKGWYGLIEDLCKTFQENKWEVEVLQIKEKFGGLRFYANSDPAIREQVNKLINEAETLSYKTCEECSLPGYLQTTSRNWSVTLCDACKEKLEQEKQRKKQNENY